LRSNKALPLVQVLPPVALLVAPQAQVQQLVLQQQA
jgi:hypothetical protein